MTYLPKLHTSYAKGLSLDRILRTDIPTFLLNNFIKIGAFENDYYDFGMTQIRNLREI